MNRTYILLGLLVTLGFSCQPASEKIASAELPILGERYADDNQDTVYHRIAAFAFVNQVGDTISNEDVEDKIYVADFFFTSCPTICPIMKKEMLRVYEKYKDQPNFLILSHSIDPTHDTQAVLKDYAEKLGVEDASTWNFLTGEQEKIYEIGQTSYLTTAMADQQEPGGFLHSGAFLLIDGKGRIRGVYDGTKSDQVDRLISDIPKLLKQ
ncbi:MAG: SCO family protein [Algoriphagus sp.]|uniref:SCO family protein n=1 Tax=Algoriphagus sp. TaxID=1872435 RepID=UPI00272FA414|nr:SCO family protein [Algoriphagus sp.]MDP2042537.1 SCO family protein [Algoriphagus sp.]MDP3472402.1 SCO family protein [Algoriphagus sp.]